MGDRRLLRLVLALAVFALPAMAEGYVSPYLKADRQHVPSESERIDFVSVLSGFGEYDDLVDFLFNDQSSSYKSCLRGANAIRLNSMEPSLRAFHYEVLMTAAAEMQATDLNNSLSFAITPNHISVVFIAGVLQQSNPMSVPPVLFEAIGNGLSDQEKRSIVVLNASYLNTEDEGAALCLE